MPEPITERHLGDLVSQHMRTDIVRLRSGQTVGEALAELRQQPPPGRIIYFYVVDNENRLQGVVPTRRLLLSPLDAAVADVMIRNVIALPADATVLDACDLFILHRFLALPVVDAERKLIGGVDVELYTDELSEAAHQEGRADDLFQLIGVHVAQARAASPYESYRTRILWLACNLVGGLIAAFLAGIYKAELEKAVALALFLPVVLALAESVSIQSVSLALEMLRGTTPSWRALGRRLWSEVQTGGMLGVSSGAVVCFVAWVWLRQPAVALSLLGGVGIGVTASALLGMSMATGLRLLRRDPSVAAGPIALAAADVVTLLVYFNIARILLSS
jgi:magnesium transporter